MALTLLHKINSLTWWNEIFKLKDILKNLLTRVETLENETPTALYKVYVALLNQAGTDDPTAIVLENNLGGTVVWDRFAEGYYRATLNGAFTENKTFAFTHTNASDGETQFQMIGGTENLQYLQTFDETNNLADELLSNTPVEIRVYN